MYIKALPCPRMDRRAWSYIALFTLVPFAALDRAVGRDAGFVFFLGFASYSESSSELSEGLPSSSPAPSSPPRGDTGRGIIGIPIRQVTDGASHHTSCCQVQAESPLSLAT